MRRFALVSCLVVLTSCSHATRNSPASIQPAPIITVHPTATPCVLAGGGTAPMTNAKLIDQTALLKDVRFETTGCPRVVLEFENALPPYKTAYAQPPFSDCGSGARVDTSGWGSSAYLVFHATSASGTDLGVSGARQVYKGRSDIAIMSPILKRIKRTCDFEATLEWVIALDAKHPFKVSTPSAPNRVVIDFSAS